ncbi:Sec-independent protein translocase subunit TatA/TatB [Deinococcus arenicola]|uniref:Sec-independent protein translocase protein TatA n=1 Tax=Deinococcus arenicola TaxID=2994950 RepID=A0ABU4DVW2_9DEIO|nr:twin-arginine translocase TatA/TatE family subunit [Deinococcus sp. ZS9-10]MDV6376591.1 twin-arginine translocase TatA/TatE family subunit [Deinococcus sp. ZS9-10]
MPNIGPAELIVILLVALVVFGPRKLPELGKSLGHGLREFRKSTQGLKDELDSGLSVDSSKIVATPNIQQPVVQTPLPISAAAVTPARNVEA